MTTKELFCAEIKRLEEMDYPVDTYEQSVGFYNALDRIKAFLDTLPDESEQPTMGYDEAYLNEKIAKASKSWEGIDVDKFMDEIRGREPVTDCHELTEAKEEYLRKARMTPGHEWMTRDIEDAFKEGAEWMKRKMMEGAVTVEVVGEKCDLRLIDSTQRCLFNAKRGDWLKIIIVKEKEQ